MLSPPGLTTQASPISARTHTPPMRPRLIATRIEGLLHPDLHRFLGSLGSLSLVWPLPSLRSYDRLVPSFVASDCVKGVHFWLPVVMQFVFVEIRCSCLEVLCLTHDCGAIARPDSFITALMLPNVLVLCIYAGDRASFMCRIADQAAVPSELVAISLPISYVALLLCIIQFISLYGVLAQRGFAESRDFRFRYHIFALACWNSSVLVTWIICCYYEIDTARQLSYRGIKRRVDITDL